jgi:hypothetical protein
MSDELLPMPEGFHWFEKPSDILRLGIIDIGRESTYFKNEGDALDRLWELLGDKRAAYTIQFPPSFWDTPEADGWEDWDHVGQTHQDVGPKLYDWLIANHPGSEIRFRDEPDFQVVRPDGMIINGDIGKVGVATFVFAWLNLPPGSWWMSVSEDGEKHTIIVALHGELKPYGGAQ